MSAVTLSLPLDSVIDATGTTTILVVRHTEVHNPQRVLYGRLPDYRLSDHGLKQAGRLAELTMPLLVMVGEHDLPDFVRMAEVISGQVPHAQHYVEPGAGHMANMEAPAEVTQAILAFLGSEQPQLSRRT